MEYFQNLTCVLSNNNFIKINGLKKKWTLKDYTNDYIQSIIKCKKNGKNDGVSIIKCDEY